MTVLATALLLADITLPTNMNWSAWRSAESNAVVSLGIHVTSYIYDGHTVQLGWETALPPPYLVGIWTADNAQFCACPITRARPMRYKITAENFAALDYCNERGTAFVQIVPACWTNHPNFRIMTSAESGQYYNGLVDVLDAEHPMPSRGDENVWMPLPSVPYSSRELPLKVASVRSLSAHGGMKVGLDWEGQLRYIVETNAVPDRIYWEGL